MTMSPPLFPDSLTDELPLIVAGDCPLLFGIRRVILLVGLLLAVQTQPLPILSCRSTSDRTFPTIMLPNGRMKPETWSRFSAPSLSNF